MDVRVRSGELFRRTYGTPCGLTDYRVSPDASRRIAVAAHHYQWWLSVVTKVAKGERIEVTAHGRVVAELRPPAAARPGRSRYQQLIADGVITPAAEAGDPLEGIERLGLRLPRGTAAALIDEDRRERDE